MSSTHETAPADPQAVRRLLGQLRHQIDQALEDLDAQAPAAAERPAPAPQTFSRPATVPPVRMEQLHRTPEPTADLDDLVDVLAPRLLERLVPALRDALREDRQG
ncbi:hypothetical protein [Microlunatus flavus]|uniref:Uncharacterized protein n=1 Tax=Microlunatus flavus TaxID=1036181 RepID=A0A1H9JYL3_9ACTN|nr:hypothetical protein [Microlunatus flavus]SEQ91922.1 hypothetical protein SAMN05421756_1072 [Microlunatus flavus]